MRSLLIALLRNNKNGNLLCIYTNEFTIQSLKTKSGNRNSPNKLLVCLNLRKKTFQSFLRLSNSVFNFVRNIFPLNFSSFNSHSTSFKFLYFFIVFEIPRAQFLPLSTWCKQRIENKQKGHSSRNL